MIMTDLSRELYPKEMKQPAWQAHRQARIGIHSGRQLASVSHWTCQFLLNVPTKHGDFQQQTVKLFTQEYSRNIGGGFYGILWLADIMVADKTHPASLPVSPCRHGAWLGRCCSERTAAGTAWGCGGEHFDARRMVSWCYSNLAMDMFHVPILWKLGRQIMCSTYWRSFL